MVASLTLATLAFAAVSASGLVVPRRDPPKGWAFGYLEDYKVYHTRYLAIGCQYHHGEPFFDQCCHPLLATESLEKNRPAWCKPSASASASASAAEPTSTVKTPEDDDDDDDDLPYCDEEEDDEEEDDHQTVSTPAVTTTHVNAPTTTQHTTASSTSTKKEVAQTTSSETKTAKPEQSTPDSSDEPSSDEPSSSSQVFTGGFATFYYQNNVPGACGKVHKDSDFIAAIDAERYGDLGAQSSLCGRKVKLTNTKNQKSVTVTIEDACPTCKNGNSIDLSVAAFEAIAPLNDGMVGIKWSFV